MISSAPHGRSLAGIIPLSGWKDSFGFPWPDYLQPLREGYLAVERSVYECALAGCDTIWVVCDDTIAPLVKLRLGDYVMSPRYFEEKDFVKRKDYHQKWIPIYYTPISFKDRDRRDSLGWSVLHGAVSAFNISEKVSRWVTPTKYFVSFPYGIYNPEVLKQHRSLIRGPQTVYISHENETVRENKFLSFTFNPHDWLKFKRNIKNQCTGGSRSIPIQERWSSRNFSLDKIFNLDIISIDKKIEIDEYYGLDNWSSLKKYYQSNLQIARPTKQFMKPYILKKEKNEH